MILFYWQYQREELHKLMNRCNVVCSQSGSESRTMAGKRCPPSQSSEYTALKALALGHPGPDTIDESWGDRVSSRACHIDEKTVSMLTIIIYLVQLNRTHRLYNQFAQLNIWWCTTFTCSTEISCCSSATLILSVSSSRSSASVV